MSGLAAQMTVGALGCHEGQCRSRRDDRSGGEGFDRRDVDVAERDDLAVGQRAVVELHPSAGREVGGGGGAGDERRESRDVVGLHVRVEDCDDRRALRLGHSDVVVNQIDMRIDDCEFAARLAPQQVGGARGVVVQQLSEVHAGCDVLRGAHEMEVGR